MGLDRLLKEQNMLVLLGVLGGIAVTTSAWVAAERNKEEPEQIDVEEIIKATIALHEPSANLTDTEL